MTKHVKFEYEGFMPPYSIDLENKHYKTMSKRSFVTMNCWQTPAINRQKPKSHSNAKPLPFSVTKSWQRFLVKNSL